MDPVAAARRTAIAQAKISDVLGITMPFNRDAQVRDMLRFEAIASHLHETVKPRAKTDEPAKSTSGTAKKSTTTAARKGSTSKKAETKG